MAKVETRKKILQAAEKLFSQDGFDGVATKVIAKEAGVTEMTLFNHFKTKKLLYKTVVKEKYMATEVESVFGKLTYDDLEGDLKIIGDKLVDGFEDNKKVLLMRFKEKESFKTDENFKMNNDPVLKQMIPVFEKYEAMNLLNFNSGTVATLFTTSLKGIFYVSLMEDREVDDIRIIVRDYIEVFCKGLNKK